MNKNSASLPVDMGALVLLEITAVALSLVFLWLLLKENMWCWPFGIISSLLSMAIFLETKLYSEVILYGFYVVMGFYGWFVWKKRSTDVDVIGDGGSIQNMSIRWSAIAFFAAAVGAVLLGLTFYTQSDASRPFADATTTAFSILATFLEAHKVLHAWIYWIVINMLSVWLYADRGLTIYAGLMLVFGVVSVYGYFSWKRQMINQATK